MWQLLMFAGTHSTTMLRLVFCMRRQTDPGTGMLFHLLAARNMWDRTLNLYSYCEPNDVCLKRHNLQDKVPLKWMRAGLTTADAVNAYNSSKLKTIIRAK
jgi:hypothetical protein